MDFNIKALKQKYGSYDPFEICKKEDIPIEYQNIDYPQSDTTYLEGLPIILLSYKLKETSEKYFVCAHELGHVLLHDGLQSYYILNHTTRSKTEREANLFALNLCIELHNEDYGYYPRDFFELYTEYGVSEDMMEYVKSKY